jgi:hypothetical protein
MAKKTSGMSQASETTTQTAFRLPKELHTKLEKAGRERGGGLSDEIRRRLEASFEGDDPQTQSLNRTIRLVAAEMQAMFGAWHQDPFAHAAFKAALAMLLERLKPQGQPIPHPNPDNLADVLYPSNFPEETGRQIAGQVIHRQMAGNPP